VNYWIQKPDLKTLKQNPYDGLYYDQAGKKWFYDEDLEVDGVNNWAQMHRPDEAKEQQNQFDGLYYGPDGK